MASTRALAVTSVTAVVAAASSTLLLLLFGSSFFEFVVFVIIYYLLSKCGIVSEVVRVLLVVFDSLCDGLLLCFIRDAIDTDGELYAQISDD